MSRSVSGIRRGLYRAGRGLAVLAILGLTAWGALAWWFYLLEHAVWRWLIPSGWTALGMLASIGVIWPPRRGGRAVALAPFASAAVVLAISWGSLRPSHDRVWADDVARLLHAEVRGSQVRLDNVRNFEWRSETDYTPRWESRSYDLDRLSGADLILSYWMGPEIAHTLVSFEFDDGQRVVFSLEIRKESHEAFSAIGGFFRQFELVLVAADERDIVRTRTHARGEDVYLYRLRAGPDKLRRLFLDYADAANDIDRSPRFYNTLTSNCTTIVFDLARLSTPSLPVDYRLLLSGHLAQYAYEQHGLTPGYSYAELQRLGHINARALRADTAGLDFSAAIRQGLPGMRMEAMQP